MKKALLLVAAVCLAGSLLAGCGESLEQITVSTVAAKQVDELSGLTWHGNIEALRTIGVSPGAGGKVLDIAVAEGQRVEVGDTLFTLDSSDLQLQLKQAQAASHAAQVAAANAATANRENTLVLPAQIALDDAEANYQRLQTLYEAAAIPEVELNVAKSRLETAQAQLNAARINQKSAYENTQAQVATSKVAVEAAAKRVDDCLIVAPSGGLVAKINVEPGTLASPQAPALTIIDDSSLLIKIQVLEADIEQVAPGLAMDVAVQALGQTYAGIIDYIDPQANIKTGMFEVSVLLNKAADPPRLGLSADVQVSGLAAADTVYVPEAAVLTENGLNHVFVVENSIISRRQVEIVNKKNANLEVKGLQVGEEVVTNSSAALAGGEQVKVLRWPTDD
jgi:multidrug resistance efflux pump